MVETLLRRLRQRDRYALARLLTLVARGEALAEIARGLPEPTHPARVIAVTGNGGVGKSSLLGKLIPVVRTHGLTTAVLACDPQSPLTGGALLGDRFRMGSTVDDGVFIRSVAAVGGRGALAEHVELMICLLEAFGFDVIFVETVGAGQGDVAVAALADVVALLLQPESGDDVQWEKAGILELADVVVIHKADLPTAEQTAAQVQAALGLTPERSVPLVRVSSQAGQGLDELWQALQAKPLRRACPATAEELLRLAQEKLARHWHEAERRNDAEFDKILRDWRAGRLSSSQAVGRLLPWMLGEEVSHGANSNEDRPGGPRQAHESG